MSLTGDENHKQDIANAVANIANVSIGCLFVATMYQISLSIQMIENRDMDFDRARRNKVYIYALALCASIIFAVSLIITMHFYNDTRGEKIS